MVTLFLRQGENGKQVLLSFPTTTPAEKEDVDRTLETLKSMSKTVTIQGAASEVMNLGLYLSGVDLAAEGEVERIDQLAKRLEHMSEVDCDKFAGMLDANSISGTRDILRLTEHLDDYVILPGCGSAQSIGRYLVGCGAFPVPEKLIGYINYEAVGIEFCDAHGGAACSRGFVVRKEGLPKAVLDDLHTSKQTYEMTLGGINHMDFSNMEVTIDHIADAGAKIKAYATITFDGMFKVHGVRLAESKQGLNIFMPQKAFNKNGKTLYTDVFHPITSGARTALKEAVIDAYRKAAK